MNVFWWPAHRPWQVSNKAGSQVYFWSGGIPQTPSGDSGGDLAMVTAWKTLGFIKKNPDAVPNSSTGEALFYVTEQSNFTT